VTVHISFNQAVLSSLAARGDYRESAVLPALWVLGSLMVTWSGCSPRISGIHPARSAVLPHPAHACRTAMRISFIAGVLLHERGGYPRLLLGFRSATGDGEFPEAHFAGCVGAGI